MRFTKIPLIATLMAVALSLLIVLPGLAQSQAYDDTRGMLSSGASLTVSVLGGSGSTVANSYFNGNLYVSNDDEANYRVKIDATTAIDQTEFPGADNVMVNRRNSDGSADEDNFATVDVNEAAYANDNVICDAVATVRNNRSGRSIKVYMNTDSFNFVTQPDATTPDTPVTAIFEVISAGDEKRDGICESNYRNAGGNSSDTSTEGGGTPGTAPAADGTGGSTGTGATLTDPAAEIPGRIPARHGDTLTITVAGVQGSVVLTVDADGPEFSEISPANGAHLSSQTVKFRFVVSDSDSGLAHDGELASSIDADPEAINGDDDNFTTGEPRAASNGAASYISVLLDGTDVSEDGSSGWRQRGSRPGVSYFLDMARTGVDEAPHQWQLSATDRAGNTSMTDGDSDEPGDNPFTLIVDVSSPEFKDARTGISFDEDKRREVVDRSSIAVTFNDRVSNYDAVTNVDVEKFLVEGNTVVGYVQPGAKSSCKNNPKEDYPLDIDKECLDAAEDVPPARIYLQLAEELAPDARPQVSMFGGAVLDLAGNPSNQDEILPVDLISPAITVTLVTDVMDRPVVKRGGEVTVTISSDEDLRRLPTVYFAPVEDDGSTDDEVSVALGLSRPADRVTAVSGETNSWSRTYDDSDIGSSNGLYALVVVGEDDNNNVGSTVGWDRARTDKVPTDGDGADLDDLADAGLLVEVDKVANADQDPVFSLSPERDENTDESESSNPFITIDFAREKDEYSTAKAFKGDSHSAVAITSITLNGEDVSGHVSSVSNRKYTLGARDLATGDYELKVTGTDDVGNTVSDTYDFSVVARKAYKINLIPGWNLVSLPGTPLDSSTQAVMSDSMQASIVLAYQDDAWLTAVNDNGTWRGTLTDIVGGYGYWVQTTAFEDISALIPETDTSSVLPTAKVIAGWNLLGVVDVRQNSAGKTPAGGGEANDYFKNFDWKVAYSFDTSNNTWDKAIPDDGDDNDEIVNGKGYWVWSTEAGTLVP